MFIIFGYIIYAFLKRKLFCPSGGIRHRISNCRLGRIRDFAVLWRRIDPVLHFYLGIFRGQIPSNPKFFCNRASKIAHSIDFNDRRSRLGILIVNQTEELALEEGVDYVTEYDKHANATLGGDPAIVMIMPVRGTDDVVTGNYTGETQGTFQILQRDLSQTVGEGKDPLLEVTGLLEEGYEYTPGNGKVIGLLV